MESNIKFVSFNLECDSTTIPPQLTKSMSALKVYPLPIIMYHCINMFWMMFSWIPFEIIINKNSKIFNPWKEKYFTNITAKSNVMKNMFINIYSYILPLY